MGTLSRKPVFKIGDTVLLREGVVAYVYDINEMKTCVYVNWVDGPKDEMHKQALSIVGAPHTWGLMKVYPTPK